MGQIASKPSLPREIVCFWTDHLTDATTCRWKPSLKGRRPPRAVAIEDLLETLGRNVCFQPTRLEALMHHELPGELNPGRGDHDVSTADDPDDDDDDDDSDAATPFEDLDPDSGIGLRRAAARVLLFGAAITEDDDAVNVANSEHEGEASNHHRFNNTGGREMDFAPAAGHRTPGTSVAEGNRQTPSDGAGTQAAHMAFNDPVFGTSVLSQSGFDGTEVETRAAGDDAPPPRGFGIDTPGHGHGRRVDRSSVCLREPWFMAHVSARGVDDLLMTDRLLSDPERHLLIRVRHAKAQAQAGEARRRRPSSASIGNELPPTALSAGPGAASSLPDARREVDAGEFFDSTGPDEDYDGDEPHHHRDDNLRDVVGRAAMDSILPSPIVADDTHDEAATGLGPDAVDIHFDQPPQRRRHGAGDDEWREGEMMQDVVEQQSGSLTQARRFDAHTKSSSYEEEVAATASAASSASAVDAQMRAFTSGPVWVNGIVNVAMQELQVAVVGHFVALPTLSAAMKRSYAVQNALQLRLDRAGVAGIAPLIEGLVGFIRRHLDAEHGSPSVRSSGLVEQCLSVLAVIARDVRGPAIAPVMRRVAPFFLSCPATAEAFGCFLARSTAAAVAWSTLAFYGAIAHSDGSTAIDLCDMLAQCLCPLRVRQPTPSGFADLDCPTGGGSGVPVAPALAAAVANQHDAGLRAGASPKADPNCWGPVTDGSLDSAERVVRGLPSAVFGREGAALCGIPVDVVDTPWQGIKRGAVPLSAAATSPSGANVMHVTFAYLLAAARRNGFSRRCEGHEAHFVSLVPAVASILELMAGQESACFATRVSRWLSTAPRLGHFVFAPRFAADGHFGAVMHIAQQALREVAGRLHDFETHSSGTHTGTWAALVSALFSGSGGELSSDGWKEALANEGFSSESGDNGFALYALHVERMSGHLCGCATLDEIVG